MNIPIVEVMGMAFPRLSVWKIEKYYYLALSAGLEAIAAEGRAAPLPVWLGSLDRLKVEVGDP